MELCESSLLSAEGVSASCAMAGELAQSAMSETPKHSDFKYLDRFSKFSSLCSYVWSCRERFLGNGHSRQAIKVDRAVSQSKHRLGHDVALDLIRSAINRTGSIVEVFRHGDAERIWSDRVQI